MTRRYKWTEATPGVQTKTKEQEKVSTPSSRRLSSNWPGSTTVRGAPRPKPPKSPKLSLSPHISESTRRLMLVISNGMGVPHEKDAHGIDFSNTIFANAQSSKDISGLPADTESFLTPRAHRSRIQGQQNTFPARKNEHQNRGDL